MLAAPWRCPHPLYAAALLLFPASALMLGSWFGLPASLLRGSVFIRANGFGRS
jgi:hypothetical protein